MILLSSIAKFFGYNPTKQPEFDVKVDSDLATKTKELVVSQQQAISLSNTSFSSKILSESLDLEGESLLSRIKSSLKTILNDKNAVISGELLVKGGLLVASNLNADIVVSRISDSEESVVFISESGFVSGNVVADVVVVLGTVKGSIFANKALRIESSAKIEGDIFYEALKLKPEAKIRGRLSSVHDISTEDANQLFKVRTANLSDTASELRIPNMFSIPKTISLESSDFIKESEFVTTIGSENAIQSQTLLRRAG